MPSNNGQIGGLTEQETKTAVWWVKNAAAVKRTGRIALIVLGSILWAYSLWSLLDAYVISYPREQRIVANIARNHLSQASLDASAPQALSASAIQSFPTTANRRDFVVQLSNSNAQWWAEFDYDFGLQETTTTVKTGFILPNSQTYLTALGTTAPGNPKLNLTNIRWHRIIPTEVLGDYPSFRDKRLQLKIDNVAYNRDITVDTKKIGQTTFDLRNNSAFGFWSVDITVILYRSGSPVAVNTLNIKDLKPGELRPLTINWFEDLDSITKTDIQPSVNILNPSIFLPTEHF